MNALTMPRQTGNSLSRLCAIIWAILIGAFQILVRLHTTITALRPCSWQRTGQGLEVLEKAAIIDSRFENRPRHFLTSTFPRTRDRLRLLSLKLTPDQQLGIPDRFNCTSCGGRQKQPIITLQSLL